MTAVEKNVILIEDDDVAENVDETSDDNKGNVDNADNIDKVDEDGTTDGVKESHEGPQQVKRQKAFVQNKKKKNIMFNNERYNRYDGYDRYDRFDRYDQYDQYDQYDRYDRYNSAYGDYSGGYGPPNMGYPRDFGRSPRNFRPPPLMFPMELEDPQGPPSLMWGRGFGPDGPPMRRQPMDDKTIRYLIRCGVGKEHLKNLPRDLLNLIEPDYCGLCALGFDSFTISRMHYISKNHLKNQKKWLNQQSELGFRRVKEISLKARELYCELCDVHITSKSHSDSHYAGKAHRAIVDGRKNPKNPFLLQRGMESRVAQLIRREKKHLKVSDEEEEEKPKEVKNIQPELYCGICKTSVTCTEQMTMHLNGKRHLTKEKQHILNVMKGDDDDEYHEQSKQEIKVGNEQDNDEDEEMEKEAAAGDKYDWGSGGGSWDEVKNDDAY